MRHAAIALLWVTTAALARAGEEGGAARSPLVTPVVAPVAAPAAAAAAIPAIPASPPVRPPAGRPSEPLRATRAGIVIELRSDFGLEHALQIEFSNDRQASMRLNDGLGVSVGMSFLPLAKGRLATRATAGFKVARLRASNGAALFTAFPLELTEAAYVGPLRLGAGLSVLVAPRLSGDGIFEEARKTYGPAPGAVADAEWIVSARTRTGIGVRASWNWFAAGGSALGAPAIGLVVRSDFDLTGR